VLTKLEGSAQAVSFNKFCNMLDDEIINQSLSNPHWASGRHHKKMQTMDEHEDLMLQEMIQRRKSCRLQKARTVQSPGSRQFVAVVSTAPSRSVGPINMLEDDMFRGSRQDHKGKWRLSMPKFTWKWRSMRTTPEI